MKQTKLFDAGCFNRLLGLENQMEIADGCGGYTRQYQAAGTVWAHIRPLKAVETSRADRKAHDVTHRITIRFRQEISHTSRFVTGTRRFEIISLRDVDETKRYLECDCVERT